jgi:ABC-type transport system involved in multi-copper enzyme maturation permease subunit
MFEPFPSLLDSPVLRRELIRAGRKVRLHILRYGFVVFLIFQFLVLLPGFQAQRDQLHVITAFKNPDNPGPSRLDVRRAELLAWTTFWGRYALLLLQELFWWIILITPAVTAGALGHEKERGTLLALFGTQLQSSEIVIGKMVGRLGTVIWPALAALPFVVFATVSGELSPVGVCLALVLLLLVMVAVGAASMLTGVWARRTSDAILACYASLVIFCIGAVVIFPNCPLSDWIDPGSTLEQIVTGVGRWRLTVLLPFLVLISVTAACMAMAIWRLRPACIAQEEKRAKRWLWMYRRPIGDDPVAWREQHAIGLAPVPWLRIVPTWMGLVGVFCFSAIVAVDSANFSSSSGLYSSLQNGDIVGAYRSLRRVAPSRVEGHVHVMGVVFVLGAAIIIGVRCSNSISEEKRRKTWEDLILTPLTKAQIVGGKRRGILRAAGPPFVAYAIPMFGLAALTGASGLTVAAIWTFVAGLAMIAAAVIGMSWAESNDQISWEAAVRVQEMIFESRSRFGSWIAENEEWTLGRRHDALPVHSDSAGVLLLRADGQVLEVPRGGEGLAQPANSYRWLVARVSAARHYPELRVLLPRRPKHAGNCSACGGSGLIHDPDYPHRVLCRTCTGLGWIYVAPPPAEMNGAAEESVRS